MFVRLAAPVALGSLHGASSARTVLYPGIAICGAALFVSALADGYYMHMGFWGADSLRGAGDTARAAFLSGLQPGSEYMICLARMGKMFFSFGLVVLGAGLVLAGLLPRWLGWVAIAIGAAGMAVLFALPFSQTAFVPFDAAFALWLLALGGVMLRSGAPRPAAA